jgi:ParB family chromosome partitioning protein
MSARKRPGLGKGLEALIPGSEPPAQRSGVERISIDDITPNPRQPRSRFDRSELVELGASIQEHGIIQPLIVTESAEAEGKFILVAGERRLQAARIAGLATVPAIVREATDQEMLALALIENVQRADLNPVETAVAYKQLADDFDLSHDEIARQVGKSRVAVSNTLRLLKLPMSILQAIVDRKITEGHARALLGLKSESAQKSMLGAILKNNYSVRQAEELVRKIGEVKPPKPPKDPEIKALEDDLRTAMGTKVTLNYREGRGTVTIHYYSEEELTAIIKQLSE